MCAPQPPPQIASPSAIARHRQILAWRPGSASSLLAFGYFSRCDRANFQSVGPKTLLLSEFGTMEAAMSFLGTRQHELPKDRYERFLDWNSACSAFETIQTPFSMKLMVEQLIFLKTYTLILCFSYRNLDQCVKQLRANLLSSMCGQARQQRQHTEGH